jgi:hypothetical protein
MVKETVVPKLRLLISGAARTPARHHSAHQSTVSLDEQLRQLHKLYRLKIYPPVGHTPDEGHANLYLAVNEWEPDVFAFLDRYMRG